MLQIARSNIEWVTSASMTWDREALFMPAGDSLCAVRRRNHSENFHAFKSRACSAQPISGCAYQMARIRECGPVTAAETDSLAIPADNR